MNLEWARKDLERSHKINPKDPNASCHMMRVALGLGRDPGKSERHFRNATGYDGMIRRRNAAGYAGEVDRYIKGNDMWPVMDGICRRILDRYPDDLVTRFNYARSAVLCDQQAVASGRFEIIGDRWVMTSLWDSPEGYDQARSFVSRAVAGGARNNSMRADPDAGNSAPAMPSKILFLRPGQSLTQTLVTDKDMRTSLLSRG